MGPLVDVAVGMNPAMVLTAFLATASIFACFSGAGRSNCSMLSFQLSVKCSMPLIFNSLDMRHVLFDDIQAMHSYITLQVCHSLHVLWIWSMYRMPGTAG